MCTLHTSIHQSNDDIGTFEYIDYLGGYTNFLVSFVPPPDKNPEHATVYQILWCVS